MLNCAQSNSFEHSNELEQRLFDAIKASNLKKEEIFAIILYTGPNFLLYNSILRRSPDARYKLYSNGHCCPHCKKSCNVMSNFFNVDSPNRVCSKCGNNRSYPWSERAEGICCVPDAYMNCLRPILETCLQRQFLLLFLQFRSCRERWWCPLERCCIEEWAAHLTCPIVSTPRTNTDARGIATWRS